MILMGGRGGLGAGRVAGIDNTVVASIVEPRSVGIGAVRTGGRAAKGGSWATATRRGAKAGRLPRKPPPAGLCPSTHMQAAVDREIGARCIAAFFRRQPGNDRSNFAGLAQALDR